MTNSFEWTFLVVLVSLLICHSYTGSSRDLANSKQQTRGTVLCEDGLASCPVHSSTCCLGKSNRYFCCPLPNAVCCADGINCCPQCFSCNIKGNSCLRPAADAAAIRIHSLVPHSDKRIQTPPPVPSAAAAVAAANKQREIAENKAAALAAAMARKTAAEESQGFVSGVLSAVKLTLFSSSDESSARKSQPKVSPGLAGHGIKSQQSASVSGRAQVSNSLKSPPIKPLTPQTSHRPQAAGISKSSGIMAHAASPASLGGKPPVKVTAPAGQTVPKQQGSTGVKQNVAGAGQKYPAKNPAPTKSAVQGQDKAKEQQNTGFFSSVFSAVTDFYSGGSKADEKSTDTNKPKPTITKEQQSKLQQLQLKQQQQQQQLLKQQQQRAAVKPGMVIGQTSGKLAGTSSGQISKQIPQQSKPLAQKPAIRTSVPTPAGQQLNNKANQAKVVSLQANAKQSTVQGKAGAQASLKSVSPAQQLQTKQNVGIPQKSAAAAIKTKEMKAKAWESKPSKKL